MAMFVLWFTGLSGAGKSTLAEAFAQKIQQNQQKVIILDGDEMRKGLCKGLGFSEADRMENIRRVAEVAKLLIMNDIYVICSLISPLQSMRDLAKNIIGEAHFKEVFISAPLETCEKRDVKGLYQKARKGEIKGFTGIDAPFEIPQNADIVIETDKFTLAESVQQLGDFCRI
jgi:adenylylsulfate kinase